MAPFEKIHSFSFEYSSSILFSSRTKCACSNEKVADSVLWDRVLYRILKISQILELDFQKQKSGALLGAFKTMKCILI